MDIVGHLFGSGLPPPMWWLDENTPAAFHRCGEACAVAAHGSWVCSRTGITIGPALFAPPPPDPSEEGPQKRRKGVPSHVSRNRFRDASQNVLRNLLAGENRKQIEGVRAKKAADVALRVAHRRLFTRRPLGKLPNLGLAMIEAWSAYEQNTDALDVESALTHDAESHAIAVATEFFCRHIQGAFDDSVDGRPGFEAMALTTIYLMREGVPGVLPKVGFLAASLPNLSRLKQYGYKTSHYTSSRLLIQSILDVGHRASEVDQPTTPDALLDERPRKFQRCI